MERPKRLRKLATRAVCLLGVVVVSVRTTTARSAVHAVRLFGRVPLWMWQRVEGVATVRKYFYLFGVRLWSFVWRGERPSHDVPTTPCGAPSE